MKCVTSLHSPPQRIKMEYVLQAANSRTTPSFPHASSGNPAEFGLIGSETAFAVPALRTVRAVLPHTALQSVVSSSGLAC